MIFLSSQGESLFQLVIVLFIFVVVLIMTYYATKWMAGYQKQQQIGKNLHVVETVRVGNNKFVEIVQTGKDHYIVIGVGKDEIVFLGNLDAEAVNIEETSDKQFSTSANFRDILKKFTDLPNKKE